MPLDASRQAGEVDASQPSPGPHWLVTSCFVLLGSLWGVWAASLANVQSTFHLSDAGLGVLLSVGVTAAAIAGATLTHRARRARPLHLLAAVSLLWAGTLVLVGLPPGLLGFAIAFSVMQVAAGCVDAAMNAAATDALASAPGRLVRFHATFNLGAVGGAIAAGAALAAGMSWRPGFAVIGLATVGTLALWWFLDRRQPDPIRSPSMHLALPSPVAEVGPPVAEAPSGSLWAGLRGDRLLGLLLVFAAAMVVEGGVFTWGVLYLRTELRVGALLGAAAYALGNLVTAIARTAGGSVFGRVVPLRAVAAGAALAAVGLLAEASTAVPALAALFLAMAACGVSIIWPMVMADVGIRSSSPTSAVGAFTASGYLGWVAGAPVIGLIADRSSLGVGLVVLGSIAAAVAVAAAATSRRGRPQGVR